MRIVLPENLNDISLEKYQQLMLIDPLAENYNDLVFTLFTGIEELNSVSKKDIDDVVKQVLTSLSADGVFKYRFKIDGVEFGLIPNFDKVLGSEKVIGGEYSDMIKYAPKNLDGYNEDLDRLMAVLFRPIIKKDWSGNYLIEKYNGTSGHLHLINKMPMSIVKGALSFFLTLSDELETHILKCMEEELLKAQLL